MTGSTPSPVVYLHFITAFVALVLGAIQLARPKGTPAHRALGWIWVASMLTVAISSLWIPRFLHLSWIHLFTLLTLVGIPRALWTIRHGDVAAHARAMKCLYIGGLIITGVFAFAPGRLLGSWLWQGGVWRVPY